MNRNHFLKKLNCLFLLVGFLLLSNYSLLGQCTNPVDGSEVDAGTYVNIGQSFTACASGTLTTIRVLNEIAVSGRTITIYSGDGTGGTVLGSVSSLSLTASSTIYNDIDVSGAGITVTNGNIYTFYFGGGVGNGVNLYYIPSNSYMNGQGYFNDMPQPFDLVFEVVITPPADVTPPTLQSFVRQTPSGTPTNVDVLIFRATFDEDVQNVDATDFTVYVSYILK